MAANLYRVILPVEGMERADAFWAELLALEVDRAVPNRHYLRTGGAILVLVDSAQHARGHGLDAPAFRPLPDWLYFRVPDLDATWERARALGCPAPGRGEREGIDARPRGERSFYTTDPFGNGVCLIDDVRSAGSGSTVRYAGSPIANLCQVILPTADLTAADRFFTELLELGVDASSPSRHFLSCDSCCLALVDPVARAEEHGLAPPELRPNPDLVYFAVPDLDAAYERAQKLAMRPLEDDDVGEGIANRPWGERSFYGLDPSGNPICLVQDGTLYTGAS